MDKKKKILSLSAIALVGGIVALSATGGIGNLKSDSISGTWIDTGDGNGYYSYEEDPGNTGNSSVPSGQNPTAGTTSTSDPLSEQINLIASQVNTLEGDENREGSIAFLQKKIRTLQSAKIQLQKDVDAATKNLDAAKALKEIKIDIYDCTKDSKYKGLKGYDGNGYIYKNPETYLKRIGESTVQNPWELYTAIQNFDTQIAAETNATTKKTLENKRKLAQDERTAGRLSKVVTCYQNAVQKSRNADSQIALYQPKYDTAIAALQKNTDDTTKAQSELADGQNKLPSLKTQLLELKKQQDPTYVLTLDENTEGSVKYYEKQYNIASGAVRIAQKKSELAEKALKDAQAWVKATIDLYACAKDARYKSGNSYDGKGYVYKNPVEYNTRQESLTTSLADIYQQISSEEQKLSQIAKSNRTAINKQQWIINGLKNKQKLMQDEKDALISLRVRCYQPALDTVNADKRIVDLKSKYDEANAQLQTKIQEKESAETQLTTAQKVLEEKQKKEEEEKKKKEEEEKKTNGNGNGGNNSLGIIAETGTQKCKDSSEFIFTYRIYENNASLWKLYPVYLVGDNGENTTFVGQFDSLSKAHEQFDKYMADFCKGWAKGSDPCEVRSQPSFDLLPYTQQMQDAETGSQISTIVLACRSAAVEAYEQFVRDSQQNGSKICPVVSNQKDATILANLCDQYGEEYKAQLTKKLLCGNGNLEPQEECDDGNTTDGDGCSSTCQTEQQPTSGN